MNSIYFFLFEDNEINIAEIENKVRSIKIGKAGCDEIKQELLKYMLEVGIKILYILFNLPGSKGKYQKTE